MTVQLQTQESTHELLINYNLADQALMQRLLLQPLEQAGLRVMTDHRQQTHLIERPGHSLRHSRAVLLAMSAVSYKAMLAYAEMLRYSFKQLTADRPMLWVALLDQGVPRDQVASFTVWDLASEARYARQIERLIRRSSPPRTIALLASAGAQPDAGVTTTLAAQLRQLGHSTLLIPAQEEAWVAVTRTTIVTSDYLLALVSASSVHDDLFVALLEAAHQQFLTSGQPRIVPMLQDGVRLPPDLVAYFEQWPAVLWDGSSRRQLLSRVVRVLTLGGAFAPSQPAPPAEQIFYIERDADRQLQRILSSERGTTTTIQGVYQTGKTALLRRALSGLRKQGHRVILLEIPRIDSLWLESLERLARYIAMRLTETIELDQRVANADWLETLSAPSNLTRLLEQAILPQQSSKLVLAIDEADWLLDLDYCDSFFGMVRAWHNSRARNPVWNKLDLILTIATDPHVLIRDTNQSPFNVGAKIYLDDFDADQVAQLSEGYQSPQESKREQLIDLLGGHPHLTARVLAARTRQPLVPLSDLPELQNHLAYCRWILDARPATRQALREVIEQRRCSDQREFYRLAQLGFATGDDSRDCAPRCHWYVEQLAGQL